MKGLSLLLGAALLVCGCSHVISPEALYAVDPAADYTAVKVAPEKHRGTVLVLGGLLVDTSIEREGTVLEVLRYRLDRYGEPVAPDEAGGRFLVRSERFLDPEIYRPGFLVTLTGTAAGEELRPLQGLDYRYPVFELGELHLWSAPAPAYHAPCHPWYPCGYRYPYDPFWYDRFFWRSPYWR